MPIPSNLNTFQALADIAENLVMSGRYPLVSLAVHYAFHLLNLDPKDGDGLFAKVVEELKGNRGL